MINIHVMFIVFMMFMICYMLWMGVLLTLSIRVVPIWVSLEITTFFMTVRSDGITSLMRCYVYEWSNGVTYSLIVLSVPLGSLKTSLS